MEGQTVDLHALRTTAASRMARAGVPIVVAQRVLGHSSVELTARAYTRLEADDLRRGLEAMPPLGGAEAGARAASR